MINDPAVIHYRQNQRAKRIAIIIVLSLLALAIIGIALLFLDDAPPNDAAMLPVFSPQRNDDNALSQFTQYVLDHPPQGEHELSEAAKKYLPESTEEMRAHVAANSALLAQWDQLMQGDVSTWRWPMEREKINFGTKVPYLSACQETSNRIARMKINVLAEDGHSQQATALALKIIHYGRGMQKAEGSMLPWLVGLTTQSVGFSALEKVLVSHPIAADQLEELQKQLKPLELDLKPLKFVLQIEYLSFKNTLKQFDPTALLANLPSSEDHQIYQLLLRKNRTLQHWIDLISPLVEASQNQPLDLLNSSKKLRNELANWRNQKGRLMLNPNGTGRILLTLALPTYDRIVDRTVHIIAHHRMAITMIALRRYQLSNQQLPSTLEQLVPDYLPQVPVDPFDNRPLRWDSTTQRLYSISSNQSDEGGLFTKPYSSKEADFGSIYWWSSDAKPETTSQEN